MMCFTEQQKQEIVRTGILVIESKRSMVKASEVVKEVIEIVRDMLLKLVDGISKSLQVIRQVYKNLHPKEKYEAVRRLDKCGFSEKEINLMVGGSYHCRNNC